MNRSEAIAKIEAYFDEGEFIEDLSRRVAIPTESQNPDQMGMLYGYLTEEMQPTFERMGYSCRVLENPREGAGPFLLAERQESDDLPTVLTYGHGDVVLGYEEQSVSYTHLTLPTKRIV